jgi:hypothetical protein
LVSLIGLRQVALDDDEAAGVPSGEVSKMIGARLSRTLFGDRGQLLA